MTQSKNDKEQTTRYAERTRPILEKALQLLRSSQPKPALDLLQQTLTDTPDQISILLLKGKIHRETGETAHAVRDFQHILKLAPDHHEANLELAKLYHSANDNRVALHHIELAEQAQPEHQQTLEHKSMILGGLHRYNEAAAILEHIIEHGTPHHFNWNNLANIYKGLGLFEEAERHYLTAIELSGDNDIAYNNYLSFCHYIPHYPKEKILKLYKDWEERYAKNATRIGHSATPLNVDKTLRIGMISDGFRTHPVGQMITSALEEIPTHEIEIYAYSTNLSEDAVTQRIKNLSAKWMTVVHLGEQELARQLVEDNIDILFDLCGHNSGSQMRTMAMKPAPILVKWVGGLINTTGLSTMDYLLSDKIETPEGEDEFYTEKLIRLPDDYICYNSPIYTPDIHAPPARYNGYITLGCFNNPTKLNPYLLEKWAGIMHALPHSRLLLKGFQFSSDTLRSNIRSQFSRLNIEAERILFEGPSPHAELLQAYNKVDIALDPWPYSGGLTTCEAMYMGVPVVTLPGPTFAGRHSATHLTNVGLGQLVAEDWQQYHDIVVDLAGDLDNLTNIRSHLRAALLASPLCDAPRFARNFSNAMRAIWQRHCEHKAPAALTLDQEGQARFEDEAEPVRLQLPAAPVVIEEDEFRFRFSGKIVVLDNGGILASSQRFSVFHKLNALSTLCLDPGSRIANAQQLKQTGDFQHVPMTTLGSGEQVMLSITQDPAYSGTLQPLEFDQQPEQMALKYQQIAQVPINTIRLDDIAGIDTLEWLVLDNLNNLDAILDNGENTLAHPLLVQIRVNFLPTHRGQTALTDCQQRMDDLDFEFHGLFNRHKIDACANYDERLLFADAVFIPRAGRRDALSENQRLKLAFLLHSVYESYTLVHHLLENVDADLAEDYLNSLPAAAQATLRCTDAATGEQPVPTETAGAADWSQVRILKAGRYTRTPSRICVGVPIYNESAYLVETLTSLKRQNLNDVHFLIIDNTSTDNSIELCLELIGDDPRFTLLQQHENRGAMANFQAAFNLSQSEYFMWLGGHDYLSDDYLACAAAELDRAPQTAMVLGQPHAVLNGQHRGLVREALYDFSSDNPLERYLASIGHLGNCTIVHSLFRRRALQRHVLRKTVSADHVLISHLLWHGKLHFLDEACYYRRYFEQRNSTQSERISGNKGYLSRHDFYRFYLDDFALLYRGDERMRRYLEHKILNELELRFGAQGLLENDGLPLH